MKPALPHELMPLARVATPSDRVPPDRGPDRGSNRHPARRPAPGDDGNRVLHLVGRVTDTVLGFLGPITAALAERGFDQTVIAVDDPKSRPLLARLHPSVRLVTVRDDPWLPNRLRRSLDTLREQARGEPVAAVHLHGIVACMLGMWGARFQGLPRRMYFSPHGSKSLGPLRAVGALLLWMLRPLSGQARQHAIANIGADARVLRALTNEPVKLVESPVESCFFEAERHPARRPLVVTACRVHDPIGAAMYAQMAVLLSEESLALSFNWIGTADSESIARLKAANVGVYDVAGAERASKLAAGWIYLAPGGKLGFPVFLAEAMAVGLACVAWDTPYHRDVIRHGETGFLCSSQAEVMEHVARLVDSPDLRRRIGAAARADAWRRFNPTRFGDSLIAAYGLPERVE